jgi:hypothetical protein
MKPKINYHFYVLLTVHLDAILGNDQLDALFLKNAQNKHIKKECIKLVITQN